MKIPAKAWVNYVNGLNRINKAATDKVGEYLNSHPLHGTEDMRGLIDYAYSISTKYGEAAAALACEMYDAIGAGSGEILQPAEPAPTPRYGEVAKTVQGTAKYNNPKLVSNAVGRLVKRTAADTTLNNAERDGAQFAWIPHGDTCSFCIALASRGWQYMSKDARKNGHAEHIHANCDCEYAIRFDKKTNYEGYDPDKYLEQYNEAEGDTSKEKINSMRRRYYEDNKDKINAQKRINYAKEKGKDSFENDKRDLIKSISLEDFENIKLSQEELDIEEAIKPEVIDAIYKSLEKQNALQKFDKIRVEQRDGAIVFDTDMIQVANWYHSELVINSNFFKRLNLDELNSSIKNSAITVCNDIDDCIKHEIIHAEQTRHAFANIVQKYNDLPGVEGISKTALKDMLESLAEAGVLREHDLYDKLDEKIRIPLDEAAKELGLW